ncbi:36.4 kDa proline-rich protein-like [Mangifera indica]|uniref:36.4 kDa proline-rich protein-like n=1 Tax=Mangifera indica TaxID=29780 RepID=UPI001CFA362C|nr:36.4 kDa proline-rich protein-like [Mangifera indica]
MEIEVFVFGMVVEIIGITPLITNPPVAIPPSPIFSPIIGDPSSRTGGGGGEGGGGQIPGLNPPTTQPTCPVNALKLGLCVDVLAVLVHVGLGNSVENLRCPVLKGLLEVEAASCLCTTIRLKLLALQVMITCGITPPSGFVCPPL